MRIMANNLNILNKDIFYFIILPVQHFLCTTYTSTHSKHNSYFQFIIVPLISHFKKIFICSQQQKLYHSGMCELWCTTYIYLRICQCHRIYIFLWEIYFKSIKYIFFCFFCIWILGKEDYFFSSWNTLIHKILVMAKIGVLVTCMCVWRNNIFGIDEE